MIFLGFLIFAILFLLSVAVALSTTSIGVFVDMPSLLFILLGLAGYILFYGRKEFVCGMRTFFAFSFPPSEDNGESGRYFLRFSQFILAWGLLGMVIGVLLMMADLNPDTARWGFAVSLLSFLYASGLALFVFLPIGLRLSPPTLQPPAFWRFSFWHLLFTLAAFYLVRCLVVMLVFFLSHEAPEYIGVVFGQAAFMLNPADPTGKYNPFISFYGSLLLWDVPSLVLMVGSWWAFRLASGKRRRWIAAPVVILMGIFWSVQGFIFMLANLNPELVGAGFSVAMLTTLYGFIAAAGFLIADMRRGFKDPLTLPPVEGTEQAKGIIDRAVENERR